MGSVVSPVCGTINCAFIHRGAFVGTVFRDRSAYHDFACASAVCLPPGPVCERRSRFGGGAIGLAIIAMRLCASMSTKRVFLFFRILGKGIFADRSV